MEDGQGSQVDRLPNTATAPEVSLVVTISDHEVSKLILVTPSRAHGRADAAAVAEDQVPRDMDALINEKLSQLQDKLHSVCTIHEILNVK